ncbi:MAG: S-methyl-5-thioribose-1-phosphate isomerase [Phycisphaerales bacterium]|nr:MAG: S-methyl-5-thioribose-1-phosphate isomerase [Phycisphaerales bacterium]
MTDRTVPRTVEWIGDLDGHVSMIDQTKLSTELCMIECHDVESIHDAISKLKIRGAPAIGIAAAMGVVLGIRHYTGSDRAEFLEDLDNVCDYLAASRPTAVNLTWALDRMRRCARSSGQADISQLKVTLLEEAKRIRDEDAAMCRAIGRHGESLIKAGCGVLTHCNAGGLATSEYGTALAPLYTAHESGVPFRAYADETRPVLQGSRLTAWELQQAGIDVTLLCDNMAGSLMKDGKVDLAITGADRIAANGDVANKIGTYSLAVLSQAHSIPFYVAAPSSTFDLSVADGSQIPIEHRSPDEIRRGFGTLTAPANVPCYSPAFDVTPARLVTGIITERGMICPVDIDTIAAIIRSDTSGQDT